MKILHICNDFLGSKVHKKLYFHLDVFGVEQIIFHPVRNSNHIGANSLVFKSKSSGTLHSKRLRKYHRVFFRHKINFLFKNLESQYNLNEIDIVHATTLYSDGAIALKIFRKYHKPYIVAARGTDISLFFKYRPDLSFRLREILLNADKIIFISEALKKKFLESPHIKPILPQIIDKLVIISNGIDNFWLSNVTPTKDEKPTDILYIGKLNANKNILRLIDAVVQLRSEYPKLKLNLVGDGGKNKKQIVDLCAMHKEYITYLGPIFEKKELRKVYLSNHIFAMASYSETFGLVYLEAMSQGLPILCSENQGVHGTFDPKIGEFVNPKSLSSIMSGLKKLVEGYDSYQLDKIDFDTFNWESISKKYLEIYSSLSIRKTK